MASEERWKTFTESQHKGEITGNAFFARAVKETPLEADAILKMLWENLHYFGDPYYHQLTEPIEMRVQEYLDSKE
jgi:hypothetical protein